MLSATDFASLYNVELGVILVVDDHGLSCTDILACWRVHLARLVGLGHRATRQDSIGYALGHFNVVIGALELVE